MMTPDAVRSWYATQTRRAFLGRGAQGFGALALSTLMNDSAFAAKKTKAPVKPGAERWTGVLNPPHYAPRVKRVIHLCMAGGMSHLETFDPKPKLAEMDGQPMPESYTKGQQIAQLQGKALKCLAPQYEFTKCGQSGLEISNAFTHLHSVADDLCVIRSMHTDQINHDPAHTLFNTGSGFAGRPSMGSWLLYGLGADTQDLPGYVVLTSVGGGQSQPIASRQWHSGFLPSRFQGIEFQSKGDPVHYVSPPPGVTPGRQRDLVDAVNRLNTMRGELVDDPEIATRIAQYEMAFRMQTSVPELMDLASEPAHIKELYGAEGADGSFSANCLLARRLTERGVRFVQLYHRGWDHHGGVKNGVKVTAGLVDRGMAALVHDLKQRGLFDDTLIVCSGEFGRTPMAQGTGRDHHIKGFSMWLSGGAVRGGTTYGATDELGYNAVQDLVHVNDFHATMLHLFGIDHLRFTYSLQGRDYRLTDLAGKVIGDVLA
jgi:hypothetical protein